MSVCSVSSWGIAAPRLSECGMSFPVEGKGRYRQASHAVVSCEKSPHSGDQMEVGEISPKEQAEKCRQLLRLELYGGTG
jgi:hypothetical protein